MYAAVVIIPATSSLPQTRPILHGVRKYKAYSTSVYRKTTHTGKYLEFFQNHPLQHKASIVHTLFTCAFTLSSSLIQRRAEEVVIMKALRQNDYPERLANPTKQTSSSRSIFYTIKRYKHLLLSPLYVAKHTGKTERSCSS